MDKPLDKKALSVGEFANSYEWESEDGSYTPNDQERAMIEDAIEGYIAKAMQAGENVPKLIQDAVDIEEAFHAVCDELGCAYDNEAALMAAHDLKERAARAGESEPFGYWVKHRLRDDGALLQTPAYIPKADENTTVTPLYVAPPSFAAVQADNERLREFAKWVAAGPDAGCGCVPVCQCFSEGSLRITVESWQDLAHAALAGQEKQV